MKKIVFSLAVLATTFSSFGQKKYSDYNWMFSLGGNVVDYRTPNTIGGMFKDHIGFNDANVGGIPVKVNLERKINSSKSLGLQLGFSMNEITKGFGYNYAPFNNPELTDPVDFMAVDLKLNYDLNALFGDTGFFDPYLNIGSVYSKGYSPIQDKGSDVKIVAGYGANLWITKAFGLKLESSYNHAFNDNATDYFQHFVGLAYRFGRSDMDKDGIVDSEDACPKTPGLKEFNGCPDTDGDGIKDSDDSCPQVAGLKELNGCPDTDGDGVKDSADKCADVAGPKENNGCPWPDTDGDGVTDNLDKCPEKAGDKAEGGCPKVVEVAQAVEEESASSDCLAAIEKINQIEIYFDFDKAVLKSSEKLKLDEASTLIKGITCPKQVKLVFLSGYADVRGSVSYNEALSKRRADAVKAYLESQGVVDFTLEPRGLGETDSKSDYIFNRRVEIKIEK